MYSSIIRDLSFVPDVGCDRLQDKLTFIIIIKSFKGSCFVWHLWESIENAVVEVMVMELLITLEVKRVALQTTMEEKRVDHLITLEEKRAKEDGIGKRHQYSDGWEDACL